MEITVHSVFLTMYYALEAALEAASDEFAGPEFETFVMDCDPFIWKDHISADPAVYSEFSEAYVRSYGEGPVSAEEARTFCRGWLKEQAEYEYYRGPLVEAFDSVATPEDWERVLSELEA